MSEARREIAQLENAHVEEAYARWAPVYDLAFTAVMAPGRRAAVAAAQRRGGLILDVGVGTGLELPMFDPAVAVVGVDLSEPMLRRAQPAERRRRNNSWPYRDSARCTSDSNRSCSSFPFRLYATRSDTAHCVRGPSSETAIL